MSSILAAINVSQPDEIYNLAAQSFVSASFDSPLLTCDVDGMGTTRILDAIRILNKNIKFYQASTSELFGNSNKGNKIINEDTPMHPASPYAASKIAADNLAISMFEIPVPYEKNDPATGVTR